MQLDISKLFWINHQGKKKILLEFLIPISWFNIIFVLNYIRGGTSFLTMPAHKIIFKEIQPGLPRKSGQVWCRPLGTPTAPPHAGTEWQDDSLEITQKASQVLRASGHQIYVYSTQTTNFYSQGKRVVFLFQKFNTTIGHKNYINQEESDCLLCFNPSLPFRVPAAWRPHTSQDKKWHSVCILILHKFQNLGTQHNSKELPQSPSLFDNFCKYTFDSLNMFSFLD